MSETAQKRRTWLVLGGSSSVARAFARAAGAQGADILLAGRDLDDLQRTAADVALRTGCRAEAVRFDAEATDEHPEFVDAYVRRADAHEASGNNEAALRDRATVEVFRSNRENPR